MQRNRAFSHPQELTISHQVLPVGDFVSKLLGFIPQGVLTSTLIKDEVSIFLESGEDEMHTAFIDGEEFGYFTDPP